MTWQRYVMKITELDTYRGLSHGQNEARGSCLVILDENKTSQNNI